MGSLTLLFRQPVAALQVLTKEGTWKYVQPQMNALTVNIADALDFLTSEWSPIFRICVCHCFDANKHVGVQTAISSLVFTE